jgi:circadian clock protein KaiC
MSDAVLSTGIPSFDLILGGGIPSRQSIIVSGSPGTGKTVLCSQIAFAQAERGIPVIIATVTSEPHDKLVSDLQDFRFLNRARIGEEVFFLSTYPWLKKGAKEAKDLILSTVRERGARLLFMDGIRSLRELWQDESKLREFLYELAVGLSASECIGLFTSEYPLHRLLDFPEATTLDGIISLSTREVGPRRIRRIEVAKLRGRAHLNGEHLMQISQDGIRVTPRLESCVHADMDYLPSGERAVFDLPQLDAMLGGGLPYRSTTLIAGSMGVGKTLLALHFAAAGARRGEPVHFLSFLEPRDKLLARARGIGLELSPLVERGLLQIEYRPPLDIEADQLVAETLGRLTETKARRLVIDSINDLEHTLVDEKRLRELLAAFIIELRRLGTTALFVKEVPKLASLELDFSDTPTSMVAENLLFLRHVELRSRLHRLISVLKMRDSGYDGSLREFAISPEGLRILDPIPTTGGLLTGTPIALT